MGNYKKPMIRTHCSRQQGRLIFTPAYTKTASQYAVMEDIFFTLSQDGSLLAYSISAMDGLIGPENSSVSSSVNAVIDANKVGDHKIVEIATSGRMLRVRISSGYYLEIFVSGYKEVRLNHDDTEVLRITSNGVYKASNDFYVANNDLYPLMEGGILAVYETTEGDILLKAEDDSGGYKMTLDGVQVDRAPLDVIASSSGKWAVFDDNGYASIGGAGGYGNNYYCTGWGYIELNSTAPGEKEKACSNFEADEWPAEAQRSYLSSHSEQYRISWVGVGKVGYVLNMTACGCDQGNIYRGGVAHARGWRKLTPFVTWDNSIKLLDTGETFDISLLNGTDLITAIYEGDFSSKIALPLGTPRGSSGDGRFCYNDSPWTDAVIQSV